MACAKKIPQRMCVGCGVSKDKNDLMRVLKTSDGQIILDDTGRKNGRGAYICKSMACLKQAMKNKGLERSFKMPIEKPVYEELQKEMEELESR